MAESPGICGPANRPCKISHVSTYPTNVGIYPSEFLPSKSTIWHAVFASNFPAQLQLIAPGGAIDFFFPGITLLAPTTLPATHTFQSHHYVIFAKTAIRSNIRHTITEDEISTVSDEGIGQIDIGEYVFEAVSVTQEFVEGIDEQLSLTDAEIASLNNDPNCTEGCSAESEKDREFRKLFEVNIPNNRLLGIVVNREGVEYRLDNGSDKSRQAIDQAGLGDLDNASYRDGTSQKLEIQFTGGENIEVGDVVFLTYLAVQDHYLRQRVSISWQVFDPATAEFASTCISLALGYSIAHYKFYEWELEAEAGTSSPTKLSGWRIVESFSSDVNFVAPVIVDGNIHLADFPVGGPESPVIATTPILPGLSTPSELQQFIDDRKAMSRIAFRDKYGVSVNLTDVINSGSFHVNAGASGNQRLLYQTSNWFQRNEFSKYTNRLNASNHVLFNVHPKALRKRDLDKWGIERFLADELIEDINSGNLTFFPFMDDPEVDDPTSGTNEFLDSSNAIFDPVQPISAYGGNFEAVCGSIGSFPGNPADGINSYHSFESNRITESFDEGTSVLVERNFAVGTGQLGPNLITIEGIGIPGGGMSCIADPSGEYAFALHTNEEGFMVENYFSTGYLNSAMRILSFRPDRQPPPLQNNDSPTVDQFEDRLGFSSMLADIPGFQPGKALSAASFMGLDGLVFATVHPDLLTNRIPNLDASQISEIEFSQSTSLSFAVASGYYGTVRIDFRLSPSDVVDKSSRAMLLIKIGGAIVGVVDTLNILAEDLVTIIDFRWMQASGFELVGDRVEDMQIANITIQGLPRNLSLDFLSNSSSHPVSAQTTSLETRLQGRSLLFSTDVVTLAEDDKSILYAFFNDSDGGISVASTNDFSDTWFYYYGVVERLEGNVSSSPFSLTDFQNNNCYLFYLYLGKILCKSIPLSLFKFEDANLIERFSDVFTPATEEDIAEESNGIYSEQGRILRRRILSYVAMGDLTDGAFLEIIGRVPGTRNYEPFELRTINEEEVSIRKRPIARSLGTAFTNMDQENIFFSATRNNVGEMKLWFMGKTSDGNQLQCHFSNDNGETWYGLWEYIENGYNRLRYDPTKKTQFIDRGATNDVPSIKEGSDPEESNQTHLFGINVHWSRLKTHKLDTGEVTLSSESQVLNISSPYVFHQLVTDNLFLFYVYESCLLCKIINDALFAEARKNDGMARVKNVIERQTRAYFIDGPLANESLQEEIHRFVKNNERMAEGNIIFPYSFALENFSSDRTISAQRVCAYDTPNGFVRVFYKHDSSTNIKSAIWTGAEWWVEDFMRDPSVLPELEIPDYASGELELVTGGFAGTGFD